MSAQHKGFTLAELLIVITIIVLLAVAILIGINPLAQIFRGYDARRRADLDKIKIALESYYSDHDCYPVFPLKETINNVEISTYTCDSDFLKPYLDSMPCDPNSKKPYTIYFPAGDSVCPQNFVVYAQIYSFFDKNANLIPYCPKEINVHSPGTRNVDVIFGCSGHEECFTHYGCVNNSCVVVSEDSLPACNYSWCEPDCGGNDCKKPKFACKK